MGYQIMGYQIMGYEMQYGRICVKSHYLQARTVKQMPQHSCFRVWHCSEKSRRHHLIDS
jgi:hypothetical protein